MMNNFHKLVLILLSGITLAGCSHSQNLTVLTREQALEDMSVLTKTIAETHFDPYHAQQKEDLRQAIMVYRQSIPPMISRKDFNLTLKQLVAEYGDRATAIPSNPDFTQYAHGERQPIFPLHFTYKADGTFVVAAINPRLKSRIRVGDAVLAINDIAAEDWLNTLRVYVPGSTDLIRNITAAESFYRLHWQLSGPADSYLIKARDAAGAVYETSIPPIAMSQPVKENATVRRTLPTPEIPEPGAAFPLSFHHGGKVALLELPSFATNLRGMFDKTLKTLQQQIEDDGTTMIILDVRGHTGGNPAFSEILLQQIALRPFKSGRKEQRYTKTYEKNLIAYKNKRNKIPAFLGLKHYFRLHWIGDPKAKSKYGNYAGHFRNISPIPNKYKGEIVVITDHLTRDTGSDLAAIVKDNDLGLVIGVSPATPAARFTELAPAILPNSGLVLTTPTSFWSSPSGVMTERPVKMDVEIADIAKYERESLIYVALQQLLNEKEALK
ncbi:S41 family peptidase [Poriferisphaera sp. WC338]|uniref:S41 family peptidase n=1 Tax=Poriferisphaera sp. WC338 TaxID=3425129 RepID=UPI003D818619